MTKILAIAALACAICASAAPAAENPWNGSWKLDVARSTPGAKDQAADGYRFYIQSDGQIKWEIPSLGEIVTGRVNGQPMTIRRSKPTPGLTLSVIPDGSRVLCYKVAVNGKAQGEGRMTLVENGKAWVDISWPTGKPEYAGELVYVRSEK